jgi:hypothetical protein
MRSSLFAAAFLTLACETSGSLQPSLDRPFSLRVGETAEFANAQLSITFRAVSEDSRCPSDVVCVWEGNGRVRLEIRLRGSRQTLALNTTTQPREVPVGSYRLRLDELAPLPKASRPIPPAEYVATLELRAK